MASQPKSAGRVILSALGSMPPDDDPRWMSVEDALKMADELDVGTCGPTATDQPKTLDDIRDMAWAKHNAPPGQKAQSAAPPRPTKHPKTLDEISASAWHRFNNPRHGRTLGDR